MELDPENPRKINFTINTTIRSADQIIMSYQGIGIESTDGIVLDPFSQKVVENRVAIIHQIPGKVEAEEYFFQSGLELESTTDNGGGLNISYLDNGDYADYYIEVTEAGSYYVDYRTAALSETGAVKLEIISPEGGTEFLHQVSFASTGGWQNWATTRSQVYLKQGTHHLRMTIVAPLFNMNWFKFTYRSTGINRHADEASAIMVYPNPAEGILFIEGHLDEQRSGKIQLLNLFGRLVLEKKILSGGSFRESMLLDQLPSGSYIVIVRGEDGKILTREVVITGG